MYHQVRRLPGYLIQVQSPAIQDADVLSLTSSTSWPGMPLMMEPYRGSASYATTLLIVTRRIEPMGVPSGARIRLPSRMKMGAFETSRMVMFGNGDVFDVRAVHSLQGQPARAVEHHVRNRDVLEIAFVSVPI